MYNLHNSAKHHSYIMWNNSKIVSSRSLFIAISYAVELWHCVHKKKNQSHTLQAAIPRLSENVQGSSLNKLCNIFVCLKILKTFFEVLSSFERILAKFLFWQISIFNPFTNLWIIILINLCKRKKTKKIW